MKIKEIFEKAKNIIFDEKLTCECCGQDVFNDKRFCESCFEKLSFNDKHICAVCGRQTPQDYVACLDCKSKAPEFEMARSVFDYKDEIVHLIHSFKNGKRYLKDIFIDYMYPLAVKHFFRADFIVYTPMYKSDERVRGYNQAKLLAHGLGDKLNLMVKDDIIIKTKRTKKQKTLSRKERLNNLSSCFLVHKRKECEGKIIMLIDDVMTTGATADAISKKLKDAGAKAVYVLTIASVTLKNDISQGYTV